MNPEEAPWPRLLIGDVVVDLVDRDQALSLIVDALLTPSSPLAVISANLNHIHHFADSGSRACRQPASPAGGAVTGPRWLTLLDGMPLVRIADKLTGQRWPKLSGSDLLEVILDYASSHGLGVGVLGGEVETHLQLRQVVGKRFPGIRLAGMWAPTRAELADPTASAAIADEVRGAHVDILVVSLGKPRQEDWIARYGPATGAGVLLAFGAAVDFLARRVPRAPTFLAEVGAEWAWRLMLEPRRLGRRYLLQGPPTLLRLKSTAKVVHPVRAPVSRDGVERGKFIGGDEHVVIAAIVVTYNSASRVSPLIESLRMAARDYRMRLVLVDNQSRDNTVEVVRSHDDVVLVESDRNLGYAGGINTGLRLVGNCDYVLILNPDTVVTLDAVNRLHAAAGGERIGAVVPLILDGDGVRYTSVRREPSLARAFGDAILGSRFQVRPGAFSELDYRAASYSSAHDVDWATGAAVLVPTEVARAVGDWNEEFFLYSEETDFFRRIRNSGKRVRFEPSAVVQHWRGGSGTSPELECLQTVNRVRYVERHHGPLYSWVYRGMVALAELLRSYNRTHRLALGFVLNRQRWHELPHAVAGERLSGPPQRGAVIIPACNEAAVIKRTLAPLSGAAADGYIELIVVCNGCTDETADLAREFPGVRVLELAQGSKPAALNAGDDAATLWPRLYLDADIQIQAATVVAVLDRLAQGDVLAARPIATHDFSRASAIVRSYYRARNRIPHYGLAMWGAGVYGLSAEGHQRFGEFPAVTSDDLFVDVQFKENEKDVVATKPAIVTTPANAKSLLAILRRSYRGNVEISNKYPPHQRFRRMSVYNARSAIATVRGPRSAIDVAVYLGLALARRYRRPTSMAWERDESSRSIG